MGDKRRKGGKHHRVEAGRMENIDKGTLKLKE
jgi:hypothetical protein